MVFTENQQKIYSAYSVYNIYRNFQSLLMDVHVMQKMFVCAHTHLQVVM
jgi:hypothetical protein